MIATDVVSFFGKSVYSEAIHEVFSKLNTLRRPCLSSDNPIPFHDWVLVRREGIELGFVDSEYQAGSESVRWGHGELLLTQAYFYAGFDDILAFKGALPYGLQFSDNRDDVRLKLATYDATRHSYRSDVWDVIGYRLTVTYVDDGTSIDRIACRALAAPIVRNSPLKYPEIVSVTDAFGCTIRSAEFLLLWSDLPSTDDVQEADEESEIDWTQSYGATLHFVESRSGPVFRAITMYRNREMESVGWLGPLPQGLDFEDSPELLFKKIAITPVQQSDSILIGHAVWHFPDYTLHVLYSNVDNRLLRVKMIAPGTWKSIEYGDL